MSRLGHRGRALLLVLAFGWAGWAPEPAQAETAAPAGRYVAAPECPSAREFWQEVRARTASDIPLDVEISVHIEREGAGYVARLSWNDPDEAMERRVEAARCAEAASATALVIALAAQARASSEQPRAVADTTGVHPWQWALEAGGVVDSAMAPAWAWGAEAGVTLWRAKSWQVGLLGSWRGARAEVAERSFSVELWSLRLQPCPLSLALASRWDVLFCAFAEVGSYRAEADSGFARAFAPVRTPWGNVGALGRGQWQVGKRLALHLSLGLGVPLRSGYQLQARDAGDPQTVEGLFEVPTLSLHGNAGLSLYLN